ncbi:MAG: hypothetical protein HY042_10020 [Spirochaetia bacterium]|nr:hypothetical protein [Spirochaetia bacterium]
MSKQTLTLCIGAILTAVWGGAALADNSILVSLSGNNDMYVAVDSSGSVSTWGRATDQLSLGMTSDKPGFKIDSPRPLKVQGRPVSVAVGGTQVLLLLSDGTVLGWGGNGECEVGNGDAAKELKRWQRLDKVMSPVLVTGLKGVRQIAASERISAAVLSDGTIRVWGTGNDGFSGTGALAPRGDNVACIPVARAVPGVDHVKQISLSASHALAVREDGSVLAWGRNREGQLGDGSKVSRVKPAPVPGITDAVAVFAAHMKSFAVLSDGSVVGWGIKTNGGLGDPAPKDPNDLEALYYVKPHKIAGLSGVRAIYGNDGSTYAHLRDGTLRGWGEGYHGALGNGSYDGWFYQPQEPKGLGTVKSLHVAQRRVFAVKSDGAVFAWGPLRMAAPGGFKEHSTIPLALPILKGNP